ncbi:tax1-binding protein 3 isoform X1 [Hippocampus zosterae]|uniref:tax1-binding protein 3 isoform X1 n=1 Tax=Hippocampus zosterae TaxID=109293 RepID=UPI00223E6186|nr:tax1-binding protein 3 isoform X1 [Hippocampus zosterae]
MSKVPQRKQCSTMSDVISRKSFSAYVRGLRITGCAFCFFSLAEVSNVRTWEEHRTHQKLCELNNLLFKEGIYVTRITPNGPADTAGLMMGDKIMQVNGWDMTMVTHDQARKRLTKKKEDVVRLLVTRKSLEDAVKNSMGGQHIRKPH